jgi:hypothetical protein
MKREPLRGIKIKHTIMGKQTDGINGGYRGRVGSAVGYMWRGQWCVRATPRFFHDAKTDAQLGQRALFKATVAFAGRVKEVLRVGFHQPALDVHKTECNYFLQINKGCFGIENGELRTENGATLVVDYPSLVVSQGPVAPVGFGSVAPTPYPSLHTNPCPEVHWTSSSAGRGREKDAGMLAERMGGTIPVPSLQGGVANGRGGGDPSSITIEFDKNPEHRRANADDKVFVAPFCAETGEAMLSLPAYRRSKAITITLPDEWVGMEIHLYGFVQDNAARTSDSVYLGEWSDLTLGEASEHFDAPEEIVEDGTCAPIPEATASQRTSGQGDDSGSWSDRSCRCSPP